MEEIEAGAEERLAKKRKNSAMAMYVAVMLAALHMLSMAFIDYTLWAHLIAIVGFASVCVGCAMNLKVWMEPRMSLMLSAFSAYIWLIAMTLVAWPLWAHIAVFSFIGFHVAFTLLRMGTEVGGEESEA